VAPALALSLLGMLLHLRGNYDDAMARYEQGTLAPTPYTPNPVPRTPNPEPLTPNP